MSSPRALARYQVSNSAYARAGKGKETEQGGRWWLEIPGPPELSVDRVWHYTDTYGLLGILQNDALWATSARMLNDSSEIEHGLELFQEALRVLVDRVAVDDRQRDFIERVRTTTEERLDAHELFVVCASAKGDDLSQWRGYSAGSGFALAVDPGAVLVATGQAMPDIYCNVAWPKVEWRPVVYGPKKKKKLMAHLAQYVAATTPEEGDLDGFGLQMTVATVLESITRVKHQGFRSEREIRLVISNPELQGHVQFRSGEFGPTPYVVLGAHPGGYNGQPFGPSMLALKSTAPLRILEIAIGPAQDYKVAENGVRNLLRTLGREDEIRVTRSAVPYR